MNKNTVNNMENEGLTPTETKSLLSTLAKVYYVYYEVDLVHDTFIKFRATDVVSDFVDQYKSSHECLQALLPVMFKEESLAETTPFFDTYTWAARLMDKDTVYLDSIGQFHGWVRTTLIAAERDDKGVATKVIIAVQDVNEEKTKEQEYIDIISNAGFGVWHIILKDGVAPRMQANKKMAELLAINPMEMTEEEIYNSWYDNITPAAIPSVQTSVAEMMGGSFSENTYLWKHPTKGLIYVRCGGTAMRFPDGSVVLRGYHADVTDIVKKEQKHKEELERAQRRAEAANNAKTTFLFNMSHDIRTPMNAIMGYTELLKEHHSDLEKCDDYLQKIHAAGDFLLSLINNVLEMARIESGKVELDEAPHNPREMMTDICSVYDELMKKKHIDFNVQLDTHTPSVLCDQVKVNEIFLNLISNAYKYTLDGGRVSLRMEELPGEEPDWVNIRTTISDTGIGMSKDFLPQLFEEFSREHTVTENKIQGTGLGMPIVKKLIDLMKGTINVESELGVGTTFTVTIPHRVAGMATCKKVESQTIDRQRFVGKRILLAEDNDLNAEIATEILTEVGFKVEHATDGIICIDMLQKAPDGYYDVILMDIQMPNMDGYRASQFIRTMEDSYRSQIPIIAMTANAFEEDKRQALKAGMNAHIAKPVDIPSLLATLSKVLK